jgi:hypothetical protein
MWLVNVVGGTPTTASNGDKQKQQTKATNKSNKQKQQTKATNKSNKQKQQTKATNKSNKQKQQTKATNKSNKQKQQTKATNKSKVGYPQWIADFFVFTPTKRFCATVLMLILFG